MGHTTTLFRALRHAGGKSLVAKLTEELGAEVGHTGANHRQKGFLNTLQAEVHKCAETGEAVRLCVKGCLKDRLLTWFNKQNLPMSKVCRSWGPRDASFEPIFQGTKRKPLLQPSETGSAA
ncbi:hypothetical protein ABBQ38_002051 [Trebouxia sp. C0009 RCD-2024]